MENVARARLSNAYKTARQIFTEAGYGLTEIVLDACFCGVPQHRKRFFHVLKSLFKNALAYNWHTIFLSLLYIKPALYKQRNYNMQVYFILAFVILLVYADFWQNPNFSYVMFLFLFLSWEKEKDTHLKLQAT